MNTLAVHPHVVSRRFLFEANVRAPNSRAAAVALAASLLLHVPLIPVVGLWAPPAVAPPRGKDVTALFEAVLEQERIVPVDLTTLSSARSDVASSEQPAAADASDGSVGASASTLVVQEPPRLSELVPDDELAVASESHGDGAEGSFDLANRLAPPVGAVTGASPRGGAGLTVEEERAMRRKWFAWYRSLLDRTIDRAYPRERLESRGVRGALTFRIELAPNGALRSLRVVHADSADMRVALQEALDAIDRFPSYSATGLSFFPPFTFRILHGPPGWRAADRASRPSRVCTRSPGM